jgi:hypothetical protein
MRVAPAVAAALLAASTAAAKPCSQRKLSYPASSFRVIDQKSGPVNYYKIIDGPTPFIRGEYTPPLKTTVLGIAAPEEYRASARRLSWSWRAITLPSGGDECTPGKGDSAAVVYVTWKRGLRWYSLKYAWSAVGTRGRVCGRKRNPFVAQDTILLESGPPLGTWKKVDLDLRAEFRKHFENGDPSADVPNFAGFAIMTDGDQTKSASAADYSNFALTVDACGGG